MGRPIEFRRHRKNKDDEQLHPTFYRGNKKVYEVKTVPPETERAILKEWKLLEKIERSSDWTAGVQTTLGDRKNVLLNTLMQRRLKNARNI